MSRLKELINKLCPDGVEYKPLWQVTIWDKRFNGAEETKQAKVTKFRHVSAKELKNLKRDCGDVALLSTGDFSGYTRKDDVSNNYNSGEVIAIPSGGTANVKYYNGNFIDSGNILAVSSNKDLYDLKFIYYSLLTKQSLLQSYFRGSGIKHPEMSAVLEIQLPVPPLEIQKEIVKILDKFTEYDTELQSELQSELHDRIKQYEYCRDKLLNFDENMTLRKVKLQEICVRIVDGSHNPPKASSNDSLAYPMLSAQNIKENGIDYKNVRWISERDYIRETSRIAVEKGNLLLTIVGAIGRLAVVKDENAFALQRSVCVLKLKTTRINPTYLYYVLSGNELQAEMNRRANGAAQRGLYLKQVGSLEIPLPPLAVQNRIVEVLDNFDKICSDLKIGLPAEIEKRQQQYEFYRNKILTFKERKSDEG